MRTLDKEIHATQEEIKKYNEYVDFMHKNHPDKKIPTLDAYTRTQRNIKQAMAPCRAKKK